MFLLIFGFTGLYFIGNQTNLIGSIKGANNTWWLYNLGDSLYYSIVTFTTLGYGDMSPVGPIMKGFSMLEPLIGAIFMALIVLVFARKWMI